MGKPVDNYNNTIDVSVTVQSTALNFMSFNQSENTIEVNGSEMTDRDFPAYRVIVQTTFVDIYGIQLYFKKDVEFHVVHVMRPEVSFMDKVLFSGEESGWIIDKDLEAMDAELYAV